MQPHLVLVTDEEGRIVDANAAAARAFGDCIGRTCREVVRVRDPLSQSGCTAECARRLARGEDEANHAVGLVAGRARKVLCAGVGGGVVVAMVGVSALGRAPEALTEREREVLACVAGGLSSERIGRRLGITPATVRTHVEHVRDKLGARTRAEAVARATALGLLDG